MGLLQRLRNLQLLRQKSIRAALILILALCFFCVVMILRPNRVYEFSCDGQAVFDVSAGDANAAKIFCEGIGLPAGVFHVEFFYQTDMDENVIANIVDGTVYPGGLLCNGEHLYSELGRTGFDLWLFESTREAKLEVTSAMNGTLTAQGLVIRETDKLWTMLLTVILGLGALALICLIYPVYNRSYPVRREAKVAFFCEAVIVLISAVPYLRDSIFSGADLGYHLMRIEGVKDGLLSGQIPVRIEPEWLFGYGYANAVFYCDLFLVIPAIFRLLGFTVLTSYHIYCICLNIATAAISYYVFRRIFQDYRIGVLCSGLFTLSIYCIYKGQMSAAVGEVTAYLFLPLIVYGFYRVFTEDVEEPGYRTCWLPLAIGFAGLINTHVLTCEITAGLTILLCAVCIRRIFCKPVFLELCKGALAAFALSLWQMIPFLDYYLTQDVQIKHVSARTIQNRGIYPANLLYQFWRSGSNTPMGTTGMYHADSIGIGLIPMLALILFFLLWFGNAFRGREEKTLRLAKCSAIFGSMLLLFSLNAFPWDRIHNLHPLAASLVSSLQFSNRFLGWAALFVTAVFGYLTQYFTETAGKRGYYGAVLAAFLAIATSSVFLLDSAVSVRSYLYLYNEEGMGTGYISGGEYILRGTNFLEMKYRAPASSENVAIDAYAKDYLKVDITCESVGSGGYVDLPLLFYKGYRVTRESGGQSLALDYGANNEVRVLLPENYRGSFRVEFVSPLYWRLSEWISLLALAVVVVGGFRAVRGRREAAA